MVGLFTLCTVFYCDEKEQFKAAPHNILYLLVIVELFCFKITQKNSECVSSFHGCFLS